MDDVYVREECCVDGSKLGFVSVNIHFKDNPTPLSFEVKRCPTCDSYLCYNGMNENLKVVVSSLLDNRNFRCKFSDIEKVCLKD